MKVLISDVTSLQTSLNAKVDTASTGAFGLSMLATANVAAGTALLNTFTTSLKGLVPPPSTVAGKFLKDDGTWATAASLASGYVVSASGTGSSQVVTLPSAAASANDVQVFINGLYQIPVTDYTVSGTSLTITTPSSGDSIIATVPAIGASSGATVASSGITDATTIGRNLITLVNPSAITFPRFNADNTITSRTAAELKTDIGAGAVDTISITTANGISGSSTGGVNPALTLVLGAITPSSVASTGTVTGTNLSGTNTGDQTITLTGNVTGSGTGSFATTIAANEVTNAMLAQVATASFLGRVTAATGNVETLTATQATSLLDLATGSLKGLMSSADFTKLAGVATGATANSSDATLLARANHTGTQSVATILASATSLFFGRITAAGGAGEELTGTQATTLINTFTTALKGVVPASGGGAVNYLRADGTWAAPPGTTSGTVTAIGVTTANGVSGTSSGGATPNLTLTLGAITPSSVAATGAVTSTAAITSSSASAGIGFATGAGGIVTQSPNKTSAVTLSKTTGTITMSAGALAAATIVSFTLTNTAIAATDILVCQHVSGGTAAAYTIAAFPAAGSATVSVRNNTAGSLSEAIVLRIAVIKSVNA